MLAREFRNGDGEALDHLLDGNRQGDVRLGRDIIVVSGRPISGALVWRPCALVHELVCPGRISASALVNYAVGQGVGVRVPVRDVLFAVSPTNAAMRRYAVELGAVEQEGTLFTLDVG